MRTTSSVEGFNSFLSRSIKKRGHFFKFVQDLKMHESRKTDSLYNTIHDQLPKGQLERTKKKDRLREEKINLCTVQLENNLINLEQFLVRMAAPDVYSDCSSEENLTSEEE